MKVTPHEGLAGISGDAQRGIGAAAPNLPASPLTCLLCALCGLLFNGCSSAPPPAPQTVASRVGYTLEHLAEGGYRLITAPIQDVRVCIVTPSGITLFEIDNRAPLARAAETIAAVQH